MTYILTQKKLNNQTKNYWKIFLRIYYRFSICKWIFNITVLYSSSDMDPNVKLLKIYPMTYFISLFALSYSYRKLSL